MEITKPELMQLFITILMCSIVGALFGILLAKLFEK